VVWNVPFRILSAAATNPHKARCENVALAVNSVRSRDNPFAQWRFVELSAAATKFTYNAI
jgi:hypothetical protein